MSAPHVIMTTYVTARSVIQYTDRGLLVQQGDEEFVVKEVSIEYRWSEVEGMWRFENAYGMGYRKMPGTGYLGQVLKKVVAMHPDYRELAKECAPNWRPPKK